jgi:hypothetical protein
MRPKLRPDVYYVPTPDGAFIIDSVRSVNLRGGSIYQWVELLAPSLDGSAQLDDLVCGLSPAHQKMARDLVALLERNGFVRDVGDDLPHTLTEAALTRYQAEIAYVEFRCESGTARFSRWRLQLPVAPITGKRAPKRRCGRPQRRPTRRPDRSHRWPARVVSRRSRRRVR